MNKQAEEGSSRVRLEMTNKRNNMGACKKIVKNGQNLKKKLKMSLHTS